MDRTAVQRAMWDRLEVEKNELKAEFGARVDRLYDTIKLEVEHMYGDVQDDIVPRSPSPLTTPNESRLNSIQHQDNVDTGSNTDNNIITPPPAANSPDRITHQTTEPNSTRTQLLTVNLIDGGQNVDEQSSSPLAVDVTSHSQPSSNHHHHDIRIQTEASPFDSPNIPDSSDHHQPESSQQPNSVSHASLTDQSAIEIKQEHLYEQSHNGHHQQMDSDDPDTNAHNVTVNIKTEPMDCDFEVVKEEIEEEDEEEGNDIFIKREYVSSYIKTESSDEEVEEEIKEEIKEEYEDDHDDDCDGCERCLVKKEEVSDDDEVDNEGGLIRGGDNDEVDDERYEVTQPNVDCGQLLSNPSRDTRNASNANESIEEGGTNLSSEQLLNTANQPIDQTVTQSGGDLFSPQTSTGHGSNRTALNQQATVPTGLNATKRKQPTSNRTAKRSKITTEDDDGEDGDDIATEDREEAKVKVLFLNCIQSNCNDKLDSMDHLHDHLSTVHRLSPLRCFATNCNARFDNKIQLREHIKLSHSQDTRFMCAVCHAEYDSQRKANKHWYFNHQTGQFECNFVSDCGELADTRTKMRTHQKAKHYSQSKRFNCTHPGCTASFAFKVHLKRHELTHLATNQFHCDWPHCSKQCKQRSNLVSHIRAQHFGLPQTMKAQKEKSIVDLRDPNEYVRVVVDE